MRLASIGQTLKTLELGKFHRVEQVNPAGTLEARRLSRCIQFYWRYTHAGKTGREPLGVYDPSAPPKSTERTAKGLSVAAARKAAEELAAKHYAARDSGGYAVLKEQERKAAESAAAVAKRAADFTLSALMDDYCDYQEKLSKVDVKDVRGIFRLHLKESFPDIAAKPAAACTGDDFLALMARLDGADKKRTSNKLRSYSHAAFAVALAAKRQSSIPRRFLAYGVTRNPVADTSVDPSGTHSDKHPLGVEQMRLYWRLIEHLPGLRGAALRVHLLSGAQRIAQLVRAKTAEVQDDILMLWDGKGKPGKGARPHPIPLTPELGKAVADCRPTGKYLLSTDGGETHLASTTLSGWAKKVVGHRIPGFEAKHLRSGVETLLARTSAVDKEVRGRLQSHGISGVQATNYNAYDYIDEKLEALETLYHWLTSTPEVELAKRRSKARAARQGPGGTSKDA